MAAALWLSRAVNTDPFPDPFATSNKWTEFKAAFDALQPTGQTAQATLIKSTGIAVNSNWRSGCAIPGNKGLVVPYTGTDKLMEANFTANTYTEGIDVGVSSSYGGGSTLAYDDDNWLCQWTMPLGGPHLSKIRLDLDYLTNPAALTQYDVGLFPTSNAQKCYGTKAAYTGEIFGCPYGARIPSGNTVIIGARPDGSIFTITLDAFYDNGWRGICTDKHGRLVFIPYDAPFVLIVDPTNYNVEYIACPATAAKFDRGATGPDGYIYMCSDGNYGKVGVLNTDTDTYSEFSSTGFSGANGFKMTPSGLLVPSILSGQYFFTLNTATQTLTQFGDIIAGSNRYRQLIISTDGCAYTAGLFESADVWRLMTPYPVTERFALSPFIN